MTFGQFIQPDPRLEAAEDPNALLETPIPIRSGYRALNEARGLKGQSRIFDGIVDRLTGFDLPHEDQCSVHYYFDLVRTLRDFNGEFDRVVEIGVFMGGSSVYLGGCAEAFDFDIDMIDIRAHHLQFAYERVRRAFPEAAKRIRLFHGDVPTYVRRVMLNEPARRNIVHHDGAHDFNTVVKDLASLSFARNSLHAVIAQDTHLRGPAANNIFVDLALYAVFGADLKYAPIGASYPYHDARTEPNPYEGNYFLPDTPEGLVLPMAANEWRYPHPKMKMEDFLPEE